MTLTIPRPPTQDTTILAKQIADLQRRIEQLTQTVELLVQVNPEIVLPEACRKRTCSYHSHYIPYGNPGEANLSHEAYHQAEKDHLNHLASCSHDWSKGGCPRCMHFEKLVRA